MVNRTLSSQVVVVGDEVESVLTAVSAARAGASVSLVRRSNHRWLGGLSTRGGLSYMDITPAYKAPLFAEFLRRAEVARVALDPEKGHQALQDMLEEADVPVLSGVTVKPGKTSSCSLLSLDSGETFTPQVTIDTTPDADLARELGIPYLQGLGGILGPEHNFLGVSPVFRIVGVPPHDFQAFEARLRSHPQIRDFLNQALPYHPEVLKEAYVARPTYLGEEGDYLDVLNPAIGIFYHLWRYGNVQSYSQTVTWIDGANISLLPDGSMGFNGLIHRITDFNHLISLSQGSPIPGVLLAELDKFQQFLRKEGGFTHARVIPPDEMYVRQTLTLEARRNMTASQVISGGVSTEKAIGTFSYWLDMRGVVLNRFYPGTDLPKPVFNVGLEAAFPKNPALSNVAFVSRSAGYSPLGQGTGRIVQHNSLLGEAIGIAAALAVQNRLPIAEVPVASVQAILTQRNGSPMPLEGKPAWSPGQIAENALLKKDNDAVASFKLNH